MAAFGRAMAAVAVVVVPGGLLVALAWAVTRAVVQAQRTARAKANGARIGPREVMKELSFDSVRSAIVPRAA